MTVRKNVFIFDFTNAVVLIIIDTVALFGQCDFSETRPGTLSHYRYLWPSWIERWPPEPKVGGSSPPRYVGNT